MEGKIITTLSGKLHFIKWQVENPKAVLLIVHGYAEHAARYEHVAQFFNDSGISVYSFDLRGHGKSDGKKAYIKDFNYFIDDLEVIIKKSEKKYPNTPKFILGHSMGGLIVAMAATQNLLTGFSGVILSNPGLDITSNQPKFLVSLVRFLSIILPKMPTVKLDSQFISRDPEVVNKYDNDPLIYRGGSLPGFVNQFDKAGIWMRNNASKFKHNLLLCYSKTDQTVFPKASEDFYAAVGSQQKEIKEYSGFYHELLNEPEKERVMQDMLDWCLKQI